MFRLLRGIGLIRRYGFFKLVRGVWRLPAYLRLYLRLFRDDRTPALAKALLIGVLVYLFSPLDPLPDWIPLLGQMDDLTVLAFALGQFLSRVPPHVRREHEAACGLAKTIPVRVRRR